MTPEQYRKRLAERKAQITRLFEQDGPKVVKGIMYGFFREHYRNEEWVDGETVKKWEPAKRKSMGTATDNKYATLHSKRNALFGSMQAEEVPHGAAVFSKMIYAKIHNQGGTVNVPVTKKMRKWAWAMYYKNVGKGKKKDTLSDAAQLYLAIALTKKNKFVIKIPKRPFIYKSERLRKEIIGDFKRRIVKIMTK